jgi:superfamily II DNA/RNA helicase
MQRSAPLQTVSIPDLWQQQAVLALREGFDVVVHAPTGAGKTFIFELLYGSLKGQAVFTVPTRALANDKLAEWRKRGWDVGIATGDVAEGLDRRVVVATLETQRTRLLEGHGPRLLVIDEYQMISDPVRGVHYELAVALAPENTQLLLLSGSVSNPQDVVAWLNRIGRKARLVSHTQRPVPLEEVDLPNLNDRSPTAIRSWWPKMIRNALSQDLGPVLLFAPRRKAAEQLAAEIAASLPPCQTLPLTEAQTQLAGKTLARLLKGRVAFHHSGLSFAQRSQLVEPLAKAGQLRVVVATMGLAAGINFSMRSVAVSGTSYLVGAFERRVNAAELLQMFGRAGRRGLDETGYALVTQHPPRLGDAQPLPLKRSNQLDWTTLLAVMHHAHLRGQPSLPAAVRLNKRLFSLASVPIGCEHSMETGPASCGLSVDAERARYLRRGSQEMWGSQGTWEPQTQPAEVPLSETWIHLPGEDDSPGRWVAAEANAAFMQKFGSGPLCRLPGEKKRYGRELHLGMRRGDGTLQLAPKLRDALATKLVSAENIAPQVLAKLPGITGGAPYALTPRGDQLFVQISYGALPQKAHRDSIGKALLAPPQRRIAPPACEGCPQRDWCENLQISDSAAMAWRFLGLIEADGTPTRRGILFSFFQHGEGLALAAALEDAKYPIDDLVFDIADLRGGPRFAAEDAQAPGRLAMVCQRTFRNADYEGYLRFGVPAEYGAGASEAVRGIVQLGLPRQQLLSDTLRMGDIERALLEWRSLLRHVAHAPAHDWPRWEALQTVARATLAQLKPA